MLRLWLLLAWLAPGVSGCAIFSPLSSSVFDRPESGFAEPGLNSYAVIPNPLLVPVSSNDRVWQGVVDTIDDYFRIEREERVKVLGEVLTEGRIDTFPVVGATLLEPWRHDSSGFSQRLESSLQTIRRRAVVRVIPDSGGFLVEVNVFKELEDLAKPEQATTAMGTFRNDSALSRYQDPVGPQVPTLGWIPRGRDPALEQQILYELADYFGIPLSGGAVRPPPLVPLPR